MGLSRRDLLMAAMGNMTVASKTTPLSSFGLIADVHSADKPSAGRREYRASLRKLEECHAAFRRRTNRQVVQLGDFIDGGAESLEPLMALRYQDRLDYVHVLGNHDAEIPRDAFREGIQTRAYSHTPWIGASSIGLPFLILDSTDIGVFAGYEPGSPQVTEGQRILDDLRKRQSPNAQEWNGAIGRKQLLWLRESLQQIESRSQKVILFCHQPIHPEACRPEHLLWNHQEVLDCIEQSPAVIAYFSGHDHQGGYAFRKGIHHITLPALVENKPEDCARIVDVYPHELLISSLAGREVLRIKY